MPTIQVNDLEMHYTERGDGPTVVALHPATVSGAEMGWVARTVAQESFNVVTPDLRGHGTTPNPAPDLHLTRLVDDVLEFTYLLGRTPVHGLGYSMGGAVMLYAAQRRPELFRSLVLLATNYRAAPRERVERVIGPEALRPPDVRAIFDPETGFGVGWDAPLESFKSIPCPVLLACGDRDELNDLGDCFALYRTFPNAELLIVPRLGHFEVAGHPMVLQALRDFYSRVPR